MRRRDKPRIDRLDRGATCRELTRWELRKLWAQPMIPVFLILCLAFNLLLIFGGLENRNYVSYISQVAGNIGGQMGSDFDQALALLPEPDGGLSTADASYPSNIPHSDNLSYRDHLIADTEGAVDTLENYSAEEMGRMYISQYRITGLAASLLNHKYLRLQNSVDRLAREDASLSLSAASMTKDLMDALFRTVCRAVITEGVLLAVLMALYSCGCERASRTSLTVYASKTGRNVQHPKALASALSALASYGILSAGSLSCFLLLWNIGPSSPLWRASMSSQFYYLNMVGMKVPFLTWHPFTTAGYLFATLSLGAAVILIFHALGFVAGAVTGDSYRGFLLFFTVAAVNFGMVMLAGDYGRWLIYQLIQWTPVLLWWVQPLWFTDMGPNAILPWQESIVTIFCVVLCGFLLWYTHRRFLRKDVN